MDVHNLRDMRSNRERTIVRYVLFYLAVVFFFSLYSALLDLLFYRLDYGPETKYRFEPGFYVLYFGLGSSLVAIPISIGYNYAISHVHLKRRFMRIVIGLVVGICIGAIVQRRGYSLYIGDMRPQKNIILFGLIGVSLEIARLIVENFRHKRHSKNNLG